MAESPGRTVSTPTDLEVKIQFTGGGFTIIPKTNQDNFVRLNSNRISYIERGGEDEKLPEVSIAPPVVEEPEVTPDPSMQWTKKKLLKFAKKEKGITFDDPKTVTKTETLSDILTKQPE